MKKIALFLSLILLLTPALVLIPSAATNDDYYHGSLTTKQYWNSLLDDDGAYDRYRLPGIVITKQNTVIIYGEARTTVQTDGQAVGDEVLMDVYLRRSTNGGKSFGDPIYIAKGSEFLANGYGETMNNPAMVCDNSGVLHVVFSCDVGRKGVWYSKSTDDGLTWSQPRDLSEMLGYGKKYKELACGPGHGICLKNGRLLFSVWIDVGTYDVQTIYSDDGGETWSLGAKVSGNRDESCVVALSDGSVMINSRQFTGPYDSEYFPRPTDALDAVRRISVSKDGTKSWSLTSKDNALIDPACAASMCAVDFEDLPYAVLFVNCASTTTRDHLTVRCSFNDGLTWEKELLIDATSGGYADVAVDQTGKVYVVYETNQGKTVNLATFSFYDAFCKDDPAITSYITTLTDSLSTVVTNVQDATVNNAENGAFTVDVDAGQKGSFTLDVAQKTANLDLGETPFVKLKARCDAGGEDVTVGIYVRCGRYGTSNEKLYVTATLKGDGEYHDVVFDLSQNKYRNGNFYSLEVVLPKNENEAKSFDFSELSFLSAYTPPTNQETDVGTETADAGADRSGGCKSVTTQGVMFALLPIAIMALLKQKTIRKENRQNETDIV